MELDFSNDIIEKLLTKKVLSDKNWLNTVSQLFDERWYTVPHVSTILKLTIKYFKKYGTAPSTPVIQALAKKYAEKYPALEINLTEFNKSLSEIMCFNMKLSDDVLNRNLKEFVLRNAFKNSLNDSIEAMTRVKKNKDDDSPVFDSTGCESVVDKCLQNFEKVQKITFNDSDLGMSYFNSDAMTQHWEYLRNPDAKIKTGWDAVDYYTNGGFLKNGRMLALIMAQAGLGKSVFLSNMAVNFLKQNLSVVVISLEMSQDVYATRFDAHISGKNINKLRENEESAVARIKKFYSEHPESNLVIKEFPPRSINSHDIDTYLENLKNAGTKIDVLIVDYLNLVLPNRRTDSMFKDGMAVSEELRGLSYKYEIPVFSATQANSEGMNTEDIDMQNVSESRGICHTADFLCALFQTDDNRANGIISMKLLKNRLGGRTGSKCIFKMDPDTLTVADITFNNDLADMSENDNSELANIVKNLPNISVDISSM